MSSHAVVCLCVDSWSRDGHKLLSAATDNTVSIWDIVSGDCDKTFRFPSPILKVQFHPRDRSVPSLGHFSMLTLSVLERECSVFASVDRKQFLITPMKHAAVLMNTNGRLRGSQHNDEDRKHLAIQLQL